MIAMAIIVAVIIGAAVLNRWHAKRSGRYAEAMARQRYRALMEDKRRVSWWHF